MTGLDHPDSFGQVLREYRHRAGLSQVSLARRAGLDPSYLSRLEGSPSITPRADTLTRLARALGLEPQEEDDFLSSAVAFRSGARGLKDPRNALRRTSSKPGSFSMPSRARVSLRVPSNQHKLKDEADQLEARIVAANDRLDHLTSQVYSLARQAVSISRSLQSAQEEAMTVAAALRRMLDDQKALMTYMLNEARIRQDEERKGGKEPDGSDGP